AAAAYAERSLRGLASSLRGRVSGAGDSLVAADDGIAWDDRVPGIPTQVLSINRLAEADAFLAVGDTAKATRALVWHEAELNGDNLPPQLFAPLAYLRLARIEQAQGRSAAAREHYGQFLRRYDSPVPRLRPLVDEARKALGDRVDPDRDAPASATAEGT
ncbi:MAG TPA: hypothetical protein VNH46_00780, partial [Gemmatimonadales bacterium]|nr:hypothetical protein [Gemmatimonadales bacterium]